MTIRPSVLRKASARIEALELRKFFSGEIDHAFGADGLLSLSNLAGESGLGAGSPQTAVQADGRVLVAGAAKSKASTAVVTRYTADGKIDPTFGTNGTFTLAKANATKINDLILLPDGRILVVGQTTFKLTTAGKLDKTFGGGDGIAPSLLAGDRRAYSDNAVAVQADGSYFELSNGTNDGVGRAYVFKYKPDGSTDRSFGTGGFFDLTRFRRTATDTADLFFTGGLTLDAAGRVYVSFEISQQNDNDHLFVGRLTKAGKIDATWGVAGRADLNAGFSSLDNGLAVLADNRVLAGASYITNDSPASYVTVVSATGQADDTHVPTTNIFFVGGIKQAKDGSIYITGTSNDGQDFQDLFGDDYAAVVRLKPDLTKDLTFSADRDGSAGYRTTELTTGGDVAFTPGGDILLVGAGPTPSMVRIDGPKKVTRVTYARSANKLTVNGSNRADEIYAVSGLPQRDETDRTLLVYLDGNGTLYSNDVLTFPNYGDADDITRFVLNLNGGNDVFDGHALKQSVYVSAGPGNDRVTGGTANDTLYGGPGDDTLVGGGGKDKIVQDA